MGSCVTAADNDPGGKSWLKRETLRQIDTTARPR